MRIGLFEGSGAGRGIRPGVVTGEGIVDVSAATARLVAHSPQHLMAQIIDNFEDLRPAFERLAAQEVVRLRREAQARGELEPEDGWQNWVPADWEGGALR
jgi:hypothetical protein